MNKTLLFSFVFLFSILFVSAATGSLGYNLSYGMQQLIDAVEGLLGPFFSVFLGGTGEFLFERVLFLTVVLCVVYLSLKRMPVFTGEEPGKDAIRWVVTIAISLLSTRFLTDTELVQTIILPYSVLGVAITAIIPTIIFFYFVNGFGDSKIIRKTLWIFYGIVYIALWASRYETVGSISWIYFWTAMAALVFFLLDGTIRAALVRARWDKVDNNRKAILIAKLKEDLDELENHKRRNRITEEHYNSMRRDLEKQIRQLIKYSPGV